MQYLDNPKGDPVIDHLNEAVCEEAWEEFKDKVKRGIISPMVDQPKGKPKRKKRGPVMSDVLLKNCRLSFVHLNEPREMEDGSMRYSVCAAMPKSEFMKQKAAIEKAAQDAVKMGIKKGHFKKALTKPWYDADKKMETGEHAERPELRGTICFNPWNKKKVPIVGPDKLPITDPDEIYSGIWAHVHVSFFPYGTGRPKKGVGAWLNAVMKIKDDEPLDGTVTPEEAFKEIEIVEEDEDLE